MKVNCKRSIGIRYHIVNHELLNEQKGDNERMDLLPLQTIDAAEWTRRRHPHPEIATSHIDA